MGHKGKRVCYYTVEVYGVKRRDECSKCIQIDENLLSSQWGIRIAQNNLLSSVCTLLFMCKVCVCVYVYGVKKGGERVVANSSVQLISNLQLH